MKQPLETSDSQLKGFIPKLDAISQELAKIDGNSDLLRAIKNVLCLSETSLETMNQAAILRALQPATADKRFEEVDGPAGDTFAWIFQDPEEDGNVSGSSSPSEDSDSASSASDDSEPSQDPKRHEASHEFIEWLKTGSGVFHIAGKPGSGKSTLMKYLATHSATRGHLESWVAQSAPKKQLIFSRFFFWKLGTAEQKTMRGLFRGIVYDILKENPAVTNILSPEHWAPKRCTSLAMANSLAPSISDAQVKAAFDRLLANQEILSQFKICLFIDGLDEFDEPA